MGVYRMKLAGRHKSILVKAKSIAEARNLLVDGEGLNAEDMETALLSGEKVWTEGDPLPADEEPAAEGQAEAEEGK